jgi:hypothetical protein
MDSETGWGFETKMFQLRRLSIIQGSFTLFSIVVPLGGGLRPIYI